MREIKFQAMSPDGFAKQDIIEIEATNSYKQHGYIKRKAVGHPNADKRGYVMEHRLVIEEAVGYFLPKYSIIHHKNSIRDDNDINNLEYMKEQARHAKKHDSGERNKNGQFVAQQPIFNEIKFRLLNKNTGLVQILTLQKLMSTTFRRSQFEFRGRFTGLEDKNGVEIYENDKIEFTVFDYNDNDIQYTGVVKFSEGGWKIWHDKDNEFYGSDGAFDLFWVTQQDEIKVIGDTLEETR